MAKLTLGQIRALDWIAEHPGRTVADLRRAYCGGFYHAWAAELVTRLRARGLVTSGPVAPGSRGRVGLYAVSAEGR
jgi:DNA-binding MarR family transcriptional regulator